MPRPDRRHGPKARKARPKNGRSKPAVLDPREQQEVQRRFVQRVSSEMLTEAERLEQDSRRLRNAARHLRHGR